MIKVDCRDIKRLIYRISIYAADSVGAVPAMKFDGFLLDPLEDDKKIENADVISSIKKFLGAVGKDKKYEVIEKKKIIVIKKIKRKKTSRKIKSKKKKSKKKSRKKSRDSKK